MGARGGGGVHHVQTQRSRHDDDHHIGTAWLEQQWHVYAMIPCTLRDSRSVQWLLLLLMQLLLLPLSHDGPQGSQRAATSDITPPR